MAIKLSDKIKHYNDKYKIIDANDVEYIVVDTIEERDLLTNTVDEGCQILVKQAPITGESEREPKVYIRLKVDGLDPWLELSSGGSIKNYLKYSDTMPQDKKVYLNDGDELTLSFNYTSNTPGKATYEVYRGNTLVKSIKTAKGDVSISLGTLTTGSYGYKVYAYDAQGIEVSEDSIQYLEYTVVCGGLQLSSTFQDYLDNTILTTSANTINIDYSGTLADLDTTFLKIFLEVQNITQNTSMKATIDIPMTNVTSSGKFSGTLDFASIAKSNNYTIKRGSHIFKIYAKGYALKAGESIDINKATYGSSILQYSTSILASGEIGLYSTFDTKMFNTLNYITIPFTVITAEDYSLKAVRKLYKNGVLVSSVSNTVKVTNKVQSEWIIGKLSFGKYTYEIYGATEDGRTDYCYSPLTGSFEVEEGKSQKQSYITDNLLAYFNAQNNSNSMTTDKTKWIPEDGSRSSEWYIKLSGLNYTSNGWVEDVDDVGSTIIDEENNSLRILKFNGDSYGRLLHTSDDSDVTLLNTDSQYNTISSSGFSFETVCRSRCIGELNTKVLTLFKDNSTSNSVSGGFSISYDSICMSSTQETVTRSFVEDKWVHVAFVFDKNIRNSNNVEIEDINPAISIRIYVNGVLTGLKCIQASQFGSTNSSYLFPLILNAIRNQDDEIINYGASEFKFIRIYNAPLTSSNVLDNYISSLWTLSEQNEIKLLNDMNQSTLPVVRFRRNGTTDTTFAFMNTITSKTASNATAVDCDVTVDYKGIGAAENTSFSAKVSLQGTSSLSYPIKNYKAKASSAMVLDPDQKWMADKKYTLKCDFMESSHRHNTGTAKLLHEVYDQLGIYIPPQQMALMEYYNLKDKSLLEPGMLNKYLNDGGTSNFRSTIDGFPCLVYFTDDISGETWTYAGSYMFNLDKGSNSLGMDPEDNPEEYYFANKQYMYDIDMKHQFPKIYNAFKSSTVGYKYINEWIAGEGISLSDYIENGKTPVSYASYSITSTLDNETHHCLSYEGVANKSNSAGAFYRMNDEDKLSSYNSYLENMEILNAAYLNFYKTNNKYNTIYEWVLDEHIDLTAYTDNDGNAIILYDDYGEKEYVETDFEARSDDEDYASLVRMVNWVSDASDEYWANGSTRFKDEFEDYFNLDYALVYYNTMMTFGMIDNAGKNAMYTTWDGVHYYTEFYDMDTMFGLDNTGTDIVPVDAEMNNKLCPSRNINEGNNSVKSSTTKTILANTKDRYDTYNTQTSKLWLTFGAVFSDIITHEEKNKEVEAIYHRLRATNKEATTGLGLYNFDNLLTHYFGISNQIGERYFNKDMCAKYLMLKENGSSDADDYIANNLLGNRDLKFREWLRNRLTFMDSIMNYTINNEYTDKINIRANNSSLNSNDPLSINQAKIGISTYTPGYVEFVVGTTEFKMKEYIGPNSYYKDPSTGELLQGTLFSFPITATNKEIVISAPGIMKEIRGVGDIKPTRYLISSVEKLLSVNLVDCITMTTLGIGNNKYLRDLEISGCTNLTGSLDLSKCENLQNIDMSYTSLSSVILAKNGALKSFIADNSTIEELTLSGLEFFNNLSLSNCDDMESITINKCPSISDVILKNSVITDISVSDCVKLSNLDLTGSNGVVSLNISDCPLLTTLILSNVNGELMSNLNLSTLYGLTKLDISYARGINNNPIYIRFPKYKSDTSTERWNNVLLYFNAIYSTLKGIGYGSGAFTLVNGKSEYDKEVANFEGLNNLTTLLIQNCATLETVTNINFTGTLNGFFYRNSSMKTVKGSLTLNDKNAVLDNIFNSCSNLKNITELNFNISSCTSLYRAFYCVPNRYYSAMDSYGFLSGQEHIIDQARDKILRKCGPALKSVEGMFCGSDVVDLSAGDDIVIPSQFLYYTDSSGALKPLSGITNINSMFRFRHFDSDVSNGGLDEGIFPQGNNITHSGEVFSLTIGLNKIPKGFFNYANKVESFDGMFALSQIKTIELNDDGAFFPESNNIVSCYNMFARCGSLTLSNMNPINLFRYNSKMKSCAFMFDGCTSLNFSTTSSPNFPTGMFKNCTALESCSCLFYLCTSLTLGLPQYSLTSLGSLFTDNKSNKLNNLTIAKGVFGECSKLCTAVGANSNINSNFFIGAENLIEIGAVEYSRYWTNGNFLFKGMFANTKVTSFNEDFLYPLSMLKNASYIFYGCTSLTTSYSTSNSSTENLNAIPLKMFAKNPLIDKIDYLFYGCTNLQSAIPLCFTSGASPLGGYSYSVNDSLFAPFKDKLQSARAVFMNCTLLRDGEYKSSNDFIVHGIPEKLISSCKNLTNVRELFSCCSSLQTAIPDKLLNGCTSLQTTQAMFSQCVALGDEGKTTMIPVDFFDSCRGTLQCTQDMFNGCKSLKAPIPDGIFVTKTISRGDYSEDIIYPLKLGLLSNCFNLTNVAGMFAGCISVKGSFPSYIFYTGNVPTFKDSDNPTDDEILTSVISDKYTKLTTINGLFSHCEAITTQFVSDDVSYFCNPNIFMNLTELIDVSSAFSYCIGISGIIPDNMFFSNKIAYASYTFNSLWNLKGTISKYMLSKSLSTTLKSVSYMFGLSGRINGNLGVNSLFLLNNNSVNSVLTDVEGLFDHAKILSGQFPPLYSTTKFPNISKHTNAVNVTSDSTISKDGFSASAGWYTA